MAIDFPNSPVTNDTYVVGDRKWVYDGEKWALVSASPELLVVSATAPTNTNVIWADTSVTGVGVVPVGGTTNQVLSKASATNYDAVWADPTPIGGLVYITQASATTQVTSIATCFTSTYTNYRIVIAGIAAQNASTPLSFRFSAGGVDNFATNYKWSSWYTTSVGTNGMASGNTSTEFQLGYMSSSNGNNSTVIDVIQPQVSTRTNITWQRNEYDGGSWVTRTGGGMKDAVEQYNGFTVFAGTGTFTGTITVYGYRQ